MPSTPKGRILWKHILRSTTPRCMHSLSNNMQKPYFKRDIFYHFASYLCKNMLLMHTYSCSPSHSELKGMQKETDITEFLHYLFCIYQFPLQNNLFTKQLFRLIHIIRKLHGSRNYLKLVLMWWTEELTFFPLKNQIPLNTFIVLRYFLNQHTNQYCIQK